MTTATQDKSVTARQEARAWQRACEANAEELWRVRQAARLVEAVLRREHDPRSHPAGCVGCRVLRVYARTRG